MWRKIPSALIAACIAWTAAGGQGAASVQVPEQSPSAQQPEIAASGRGEMRLAPTYAAVIVNISTRSSTAVEAASENTKKVQAVMRALRASGLSEKDITTASYNVQQDYDYRPDRRPEPSGFSANTSIRAEIRRLDNLGRVIDAAIAGGATGISGVQYFASNTEEARRSAMAQAVREARTDADVLARAAGGTLGRLIALNSAGINQPFPRPIMMEAGGMAMARAASPTNIVPGELTVVAMVSGRWEFIPGGTR
jgi:uncharacterized protein YggE